MLAGPKDRGAKFETRFERGGGKKEGGKNSSVELARRKLRITKFEISKLALAAVYAEERVDESRLLVKKVYPGLVISFDN